MKLACAHMMGVCLLVACLLVLEAAAASATEPQGFSVQPAARPDGKPWRIAYMEGGEYSDYTEVLRGVAGEWAKMGWLERPGCLESSENTREIWSCLASLEGPYVEFVADAFWSAGWNEEHRDKNRKDFLRRSSEKGGLDLVIAMGTWAGQDLANNEHSVPTIVMSTSNAVQAGIIKSAEDSGYDHVHARVDPLRYYRQVRFFHDIVEFKSLGVVYEDTVAGRTHAALDSVKKAAEELGFELHGCPAKLSEVSLNAAEAAVVACHEELARKVEAVYITINRAVNPGSMSRLLEPLFTHGIPNFAMGALYEVRQGALMSMAQPEYYHLYVFWAQIIAKVLNGALPRQLPQVLEDPHNIAVNLQAARMLGFDFPLEVLGGAEVIYETIEPAQNISKQ